MHWLFLIDRKWLFLFGSTWLIQPDANTVSSLRNLLNEYEREVKKYLRRESKEIMTINVRNKVSELENDLQVIRQYRKNINCYCNLGLINKIPYVRKLFVNLWNKVITVVIIIKDFFYKKRGKLE